MTLEKIKELVGASGFIDNPSDMEAYTTSWRGGWKGKTPLVVFPDSAKKVSEIIKICASEKIAIVPQGGNTGLVGGATPSSSGKEIIINLSRMNKIKEIDLSAFTMTVEAGCVLANMQSAALEKGRLFPISIASEGSAQAGGIVSTNAGGTAVLKYGTTRDIVLGLEAVLPDGSIWNGLKTLRKDNTGYDLKNIFIGAEGTLGIVTAATFKLFPMPKQKETFLLAVKDANTAIELLARFREGTGDLVNAFEIISGECMALVLKHIPNTRAPFAKTYPEYILAEFSSPFEGDFLRSQLENMLSAEFESGRVLDAIMAESIAQAKEIWHIREHISEAEKKEGRGVHFDVSLPIATIPDFMESAGKTIKNKVSDAQIIAFGHIGDGNMHYNMCLPKNISDGDFLNKKKILKEIIYSEIKKRDGSISAEHGVGQERKEDLKNYKAPIDIELMKKIKAALDPDNIMNPGKIF